MYFIYRINKCGIEAVEEFLKKNNANNDIGLISNKSIHKLNPTNLKLLTIIVDLGSDIKKYCIKITEETEETEIMEFESRFFDCGLVFDYESFVIDGRIDKTNNTQTNSHKEDYEKSDIKIMLNVSLICNILLIIMLVIINNIYISQ